MQYVKMRWLYAIGILYLTALTFGDEPKIVIIGAGASGIAAASKLYENGFENIVILEAENRIGGRVYTTWFDGSWVDVGGQWVHGNEGNIVFELASPLGLLEIPPGMEDITFTVYDSKGLRIPDLISDNLIKSFLEILGDADANDGSIGEYLSRTMTTEIEKYPTVNRTLAKQFMKLFEGMEMSSDASDNWDETSAKGYKESWTCPGNQKINWKDKGYGTILDILMKKYPNPAEELPILNNTMLNTEVANVDYNSIEGKASVKTSNGRQYIADHVIVTPSLGVLKEQHKTLFTPQLSESKVKSINGLGFGTVGKILLSFETPWWPSDDTNLAFIWDDDDRQKYENDRNKKWLVDLLGVFTLAHRPRILYSWVGGASARHMETLPEDQVLNQMYGVIKKFLGKSYNITRPSGVKRSQWFTNKHFRGSYSFRSMESEKVHATAEELGAPLLVKDKPIVMFAGEATHPHYYSNVHGAIESGFREADRLIDLYKSAADSCCKKFSYYLYVPLITCILHLEFKHMF